MKIVTAVNFQYNMDGKKIFDKKASCQSRQPADEQCGLHERFLRNGWLLETETRLQRMQRGATNDLI